MKIAIQGHPTRGKEVIQILESLGGKNQEELTGRRLSQYYFINCNGYIDLNLKINLLNHKFYALEEFEKEFPFKIGDKVKYISSIGIIKEYCYINNEPAYKVKSAELGIIVTMPAEELKPYKKMERNITLTLEKAKEWYNKGGELKEIALQAFSEKELNPLPKSWEEYCRKHKSVCLSTRYADMPLKYDALIKLEQLRNCWWNGWEPEWNNCEKYVIKWDNDDLIVFTARNIRAFLVFPTREMAYEFLKCFRDLIEQARDLI